MRAEYRRRTYASGIRRSIPGLSCSVEPPAALGRCGFYYPRAVKRSVSGTPWGSEGSGWLYPGGAGQRQGSSSQRRGYSLRSSVRRSTGGAGGTSSRLWIPAESVHTIRCRPTHPGRHSRPSSSTFAASMAPARVGQRTIARSWLHVFRHTVSARPGGGVDTRGGSGQCSAKLGHRAGQPSVLPPSRQRAACSARLVTWVSVNRHDGSVRELHRTRRVMSQPITRAIASTVSNETTAVMAAAAAASDAPSESLGAMQV